jgi:hypothetical protein
LDDLIVAFPLVETLFWVRSEGYLEVFVRSGEAVRRDFVFGLELAKLGGRVQVNQTLKGDPLLELVLLLGEVPS